MFIFLDTETTGTGPDDRLCQIAFKPEQGRGYSGLFNPGRPIAVEAMAVHHITNEMVKDKPRFKESAVCMQLSDLVADPNSIVVAHNAKFDIDMLRKEGIDPPKVICTLKLARYLDKAGAIPQYNLQYLRYYLDLKVEAKAHDAMGDIIVLEALFRRIHARFESDGVKEIESEMIRISHTPILIARMPFGKHKGMLFSEIPTDDLEWLYGTDLDEDMAHTVRHQLGRA
ncbi:MAG: exonuclease domain-containing protein [Desulfobacteraceae bacterium]